MRPAVQRCVWKLNADPSCEARPIIVSAASIRHPYQLQRSLGSARSGLPEPPPRGLKRRPQNSKRFRTHPMERRQLRFGPLR